MEPLSDAVLNDSLESQDPISGISAKRSACCRILVTPRRSRRVITSWPYVDVVKGIV